MALPGHAHGLSGVRYLGLLATKTRPLSYLPITPRPGNMSMWGGAVS